MMGEDIHKEVERLEKQYVEAVKRFDQVLDQERMLAYPVSEGINLKSPPGWKKIEEAEADRDAAWQALKEA
jgi:hypothetical protein